MATRGKNLARLSRGTYSEGGEVLDRSLWDSGILAAATLVHRLFTVPLGAGAPAKTLDRTNNTVAGQMPQGQNLTIRAIKFWYWSSHQFASVDILRYYTFLATSTLEILVPGKDRLGEWTLAELSGQSSMIPFTPTVAGNVEPLNMPRFHGVTPLNTPIVLAALTPYEARVTHHTAVNASLAGDTFWISLVGTQQRAN